MKQYGYDIGIGWLGQVENGKKMPFSTETEYDEYCDEETEED